MYAQYLTKLHTSRYQLTYLLLVLTYFRISNKHRDTLTTISQIFPNSFFWLHTFVRDRKAKTLKKFYIPCLPLFDGLRLFISLDSHLVAWTLYQTTYVLNKYKNMSHQKFYNWWNLTRTLLKNQLVILKSRMDYVFEFCRENVGKTQIISKIHT